MSSRAIRRIASWIALLAVVAVTFMPSLTAAFSAGSFAPEVCSAGASRGSIPDDSHHILGHCPYCALHAELALPPQRLAPGAVGVVLFREVPPAFLAAPHARSVWTSAQSRAPPVFA